MTVDTTERQQLTAYKGMVGWIAFPKTWLETFDMKKGFWANDDAAFINFGDNGAFQVRRSGGMSKISKEDQDKIPWGEFCSPWETYQTGVIFGVAKKHTHLDELK